MNTREQKKSGPLTNRQKEILRELHRREAYVCDGTAVTSTETDLRDRYCLWIHWRSAVALERRGLVIVYDEDRFGDEGGDVVLTREGKAWVEAQELNTVLP